MHRFAVVAKLVAWVAVGALAVAGLAALILPAGSDLRTAVDSRAGGIPAFAAQAERTTIYDADGAEVAQLYSGEDRSSIPLEQVPAKVTAAILATEDRDFFNHRGIDWKGTIRAFVRDVSAGGVKQGGSTITQQLVKNTMFAGGRGRNAKDKIREAVLALRIEGQYSKREILERYLNTIYFGHGAYGIKAAAERYFHKPVQQLALLEAAMLAGVISNPEAYDPIAHPVAARARRAKVLQSMVAVGVITDAEAQRYNTAGLPTTISTPATYGPNSSFVDAMQRSLVDQDNAASRSLGSTPSERRNRLYRGGLRITTTWDPTIQQHLDDAVAAAALDPRLAVSTTVVDNRTGAVRAVYPNLHYGSGVRALAPAVRQPGSTFKTFTLAAALENGYSPDDSVNGGTCAFKYPVTTSDWAPATDRSGVMSLRSAYAYSVNCAFARLELSMGHGTAGPKKVNEMAHRLGVTHRLADVSSITLGVSEVTTLDIASAFSTIASDGLQRTPSFVSQIVDRDGTVLFQLANTTGRQVLSAEVARTMTDIMRGVIDKPGATANRARLSGGRQAAGKTGTTNDGTDIWFTGFTPELTASIWVGQYGCACSLQPILRGDAYGGRIPARIWADFMNAALDGRPVSEFLAPDPAEWPRRAYLDEDGRRSDQPPPTYSTRPSTTTTSTATSTTKPGAKATTTTKAG